MAGGGAESSGWFIELAGLVVEAEEEVCAHIQI